MRRARIDFLAKAQAAWGKQLPDWVAELVRECNRSSAAGVAKRIGYSGAVVSQIIASKYPGDIARVEQKVRGALMGDKVMCPVVGEIGRDRCLDEQRMGNTGASSIRAKLYRACRSGCPHSHIGGGDAQ
jgi:uncharacterized protein involved in cysteine biosynthesis